MSTSGHTDELLVQKLLNTGCEIAELMLVLESIDNDAALAELNETTISDNNGGRITL